MVRLYIIEVYMQGRGGGDKPPLALEGLQSTLARAPARRSALGRRPLAATDRAGGFVARHPAIGANATNYYRAIRPVGHGWRWCEELPLVGCCERRIVGQLARGVELCELLRTHCLTSLPQIPYHLEGVGLPCVVVNAQYDACR